MRATSIPLDVSEHVAMPRMRFRTAWLAAAGIVAVALLTIPFLLRLRDPIRRLAASTPRSERIVEARISGGFAWAPYRGPVRTSDQANDPRRMMLGGVAGDLIEAAKLYLPVARTVIRHSRFRSTGCQSRLPCTRRSDRDHGCAVARRRDGGGGGGAVVCGPKTRML
jgi:hypothetical protein